MKNAFHNAAKGGGVLSCIFGLVTGGLGFLVGAYFLNKTSDEMAPQAGPMPG